MVAIKSFTQLSLSRPSSQNSTSRSMTPSPSSSSAHATVISRPKCNDDYYLSDEQLVIRRPNLRSRSAGSLARKADLSMSFTNPPNVTLAWEPRSSQEDLTGTTVPTVNVLSSPVKSSPLPTLTGRSRHTMVMAPTPTVACGHTIQPTPHTSGAHRPLLSTLLSVSTRASPNITRSNSPMETSNKLNSSTSTNPMVKNHLQLLEASYVSKVGTRLKDLVNKVFPSHIENGLIWKGRIAPRPNAAFELGEALKHELSVSSSDSYISRALLRTAVIPALTVYIGRLDPLLVSATTEPTALYLPKNVKEVDNSLPLVLRYNIEVIKSAWVIRNSLEEICDGKGWEGDGPVPKVLIEGLQPFEFKLDAIVQRFMGPYLIKIKEVVMDKILNFRNESISLHSHIRGLPLGLSKSTSGIGLNGNNSTSTNDNMNELSLMLEGIRKLLMIKLNCGNDSKTWIVSIGSQAVWKALLAFSSRPGLIIRNNLQTVPPIHHDNSIGISRSARHILRSATTRRSPSPTTSSEYLIYTELSNETKTFYNIIASFVKGIAGLGTSNRPNSPLSTNELDCIFCSHGFLVNENQDNDDDLVRDAMNEALEAFSSFRLILLSLLHPKKLIDCLESSSTTTTKGGSIICKTLNKALQEIPPLILLHLLISRIKDFKLPHQIWNISWNEYCQLLKGFGAAEVWCKEIGIEVLNEVKRLKFEKRQQSQDKKEEEEDGDMEKLIKLVCFYQLEIKD
ncbi:hypothetical protein CROQUDRAFT_670864 [Cronartium quercuum f. sp. fusiforme G11]|uniref:Uncharacterized protein n=1 Tax=Cronartium quercuum f. sp. fusiforme G11 TaxID=708437 RepID=A0A9P6TC49_9BASI|nr:hypothetical protein CROQUDRAFT_670864 [Cronartium quercuum f. sp. fusiforme G11]